MPLVLNILSIVYLQSLKTNQNIKLAFFKFKSGFIFMASYNKIKLQFGAMFTDLMVGQTFSW